MLRGEIPLFPRCAVPILGLSAMLIAPGPAVADGEFQLLWHRERPEARYTSVGASQGEWVFAGGGEDISAPSVAECYAVWGFGTPEWAHVGSEFHVDASRGGMLLAGTEFDAADSSVTVKAWHPNSATPLWSYRVRPCQPLSGEGWRQGKGIQVSDDGSTIAVLVAMYATEGMQGRLYVFEPTHPDPTMVYDLPIGSCSALAVTPDGSLIAVCARPYIHVLDRAAGNLRWRGPAGLTNDAIGISGDGRYIAWGYSSLTLREWDGANYEQIWSTSHGGDYLLSECAFTPGAELLALCWFDEVAYADIVIELYALPDATPVWYHSYADEPRGGAGRADGVRTPTDVPSEMLFAGNDVLAVSSWGGTFPEIHVFERAQPEPLLVYDTPGSMMDIDVVQTPDATYVTAGGGAVPYWQSMEGGDIYTFACLGGGTVAPLPDSDGPNDACLTRKPNPFREHTTLGYRLAAPGRVRLTVHDPQGRAVATLVDAVTNRGQHAVAWAGQDVTGRQLPAGVYWLRLLGPDGARRQAPIVLLDSR